MSRRRLQIEEEAALLLMENQRHAGGLSLPNTNLLAWWDANRDIYSDTGLTTPAANGAGVGGWKDQGGGAYHVLQATAGDRPIYRTSVAALNNKPAVEFVSNDYLRATIAAAIAGNLNVYNIFCVFTSTNSASTGYLYCEGRSTSLTPRVSTRITNGLGQSSHVDDAATDAAPSKAGTYGDGVKHLLTCRRTASNNFIVRVDGVASAANTNAPGATTIDRVAIGARTRNNAQDSFVAGHIAQIAVYGADNFATIEPLLAAEYGITLP